MAANKGSGAAAIGGEPLLTPAELAAISSTSPTSSNEGKRLFGEEAYRPISSTGFRGLVNQGCL
jgi:hypothetical protein